MFLKWFYLLAVAAVPVALNADDCFFDEYDDVELFSEKKEIHSPEEDLSSLVEEAEEEKEADASFKKKALVGARKKLLQKKYRGPLSEQEIAEKQRSKEKSKQSLASPKESPEKEEPVAQEEKPIRPSVILSPPKEPEKKPSGASVKIEKRKEPVRT